VPGDSGVDQQAGRAVTAPVAGFNRPQLYAAVMALAALNAVAAKVVQALFSPESIAAKRNTDAIEVGNGAMMAARLIEYKPSALRPFEEVQAEIHRQLVLQAASELAKKAGRDKLALLEQGKSDKEAGVTFGKPVTVGRGQFQAGLSPDVLTRVFQLNPDKLPSYTGATNERGGFSIVKVLQVITPSEGDKARVDMASSRLSDQLGREMLAAYMASLKAKADVKINQANLDKK